MSRPAAAIVLVACVAVPCGLPAQPHKAAGDRLGDPLPPGAIARIGTVRLRHSAGILALAFSPDGKILATGSHDRSLRLWEVRTGREIRRLPQIKGPVWTVAFSPDGRLLTASGWQNTIHLWEAATGKEVRRVPGRMTSAMSLSFSPDGKSLASVMSDRTVKLWDVGTGKLRHALADPQDALGWAAFLPNGKTLLTCSERGVEICYWDVASGQRLDRQEPEVGRGYPVALTPDGKSLLTVSAGLTERWDLATGKPTGTYKGTHPALTPDGKMLTTFHEAQLRLWDLASGKEVRRFPVGRDTACAAVFAPDGKTLALTGQAVHFWDVSTGKQILPFGDDPGPIVGLALSADGTTAVSVSDSGTVFLWEAATGRPRGRVAGMTAGPYGLAASPDGRTIAARNVGTSAIVLGDIKGERPVRTLRSRQQQIGDIAFSPDGSSLAAVGNREIALWDVASGKQTRRLAEGYAFTPVAFAADGKGVFSHGHGGTVSLWNLDTGRRARTFREPLEGDAMPAVIRLAPSPDGKLLAVSLAGRREVFGVELWEVATARRVGVLAAQRTLTWAMAFSPDGRLLASCGEDGTVPLWDVLTGQERQCFTGHRGSVMQVAFSADGRRVVSRGADGTGLVWDVSGLRKQPAPATLPKAVLEKCWADLADPDAAVAYRAVGRLVGAPRDAVAFLKARLRPATEAPAARVAALIRDLDSPRFAVRQAAMSELAKLGDLAGPALRAVLAGKASLEKKQRAEQLLQRSADIPAEQLRPWRALAVLEYVGGPEARGVLEALAGGAPQSRVTREARAALRRLAARNRVPR